MSGFSGALQSPRDFRTMVAFGLVNGYSLYRFQGQDNTANAGDDVWPLGGAYPYPVAPVAMEIVSASAQDSAGGTGARTVAILGLDASMNLLPVQVVTMNGVTAVPIPTSLFRIFDAWIVTAGSNGANVGNVTVRTLGGAGTNYARMLAGYGDLRQAARCVPAGYDAVILTLGLTPQQPTNTTDFRISLWTRNVSTGAVDVPQELGSSVGSFQLDSVDYLVPGGSDVSLKVAYTSGANLPIEAGFSMMLRQRAPNIG